MNRKETQLLVENWRAVLNDDYTNYDSFILNENLLVENFMQNVAKSAGNKAGQMLQGLGIMLMMNKPAEAKLNNIPEVEQQEVMNLVQYALQYVNLSPENKEKLVALAAKIQDDKNYEPTEDDLKLLDFCAEQIGKISDAVSKDYKDAKKEYKDALAQVDEVLKAGGESGVDKVAEVNARLKSAQEEIHKSISRINALTRVTYTFTDTLERTGPMSKTRTITAKSPDSEKPVFQSKAKYTGF